MCHQNFAAPSSKKVCGATRAFGRISGGGGAVLLGHGGTAAFSSRRHGARHASDPAEERGVDVELYT